MSLDLCLKQLHVVHIKVILRMQYIRLLLFYSVIFQSCKFSYPGMSHAQCYRRVGATAFITAQKVTLKIS